MEPRKLEHIQVLRGVAALLVVLFHLTGSAEAYLGTSFLNGFFDFGWAGVELFFVLSGFIMVAVHRGQQPSRAKWSEFILKRLIRVYPIYLGVTLAVLPVYVFSHVGDAYKRDLGVILKSLFLIPQDPGRFPVVSVGWSLSHEMLFYLVFSLTFVLPKRVFRGVCGAWGLAIALALFLPGISGVPVASHFLLSPYNLEFVFGCACAAVLMRVRRHGWPLLLTGTLLFMGLGLANNLGGLAALQTRISLLFAAAAMLIVLGAASLDAARSSRLPKVLLLLGDASYSVYLTHGFIINLAFFGVQKLLAPQGAMIQGISLVVLALAVALGCAVYLWVERPLIEALRTRLLARRRRAWAVNGQSAS
jgi:peptidoglycan/LPS O-acetylase OafA/YrhL